MANAHPTNGFKPGQSGNVNGRPKKGKTLTDLIEKKLNKEKFAQGVCNLAYEGNIAAIKEILDRVDGKVVESQIIRTITGVSVLDNATDKELDILEESLEQELEAVRNRTRNSKVQKKRKKVSK